MNKTIVISNPKTLKKLNKHIPRGPYEVKCTGCRNTAQGKTINEAHLKIKHHPNCSYNFGVNTFFDSRDMSVSKSW